MRKINYLFFVFIILFVHTAFANTSTETIGSKIKKVLDDLQFKQFDSCMEEDGTHINFALKIEVGPVLGREAEALLNASLKELHRHLEYKSIHAAYNGKTLKIGTYTLYDSIGKNPYSLIESIKETSNVLVTDINEGWYFSRTPPKDILTASEYETLQKNCHDFVLMQRTSDWKRTDPIPFLKALVADSNAEKQIILLNVKTDVIPGKFVSYIAGEKTIIEHLLKLLKTYSLVEHSQFSTLVHSDASLSS